MVEWICLAAGPGTCPMGPPQGSLVVMAVVLPLEVCPAEGGCCLAAWAVTIQDLSHRGSWSRISLKEVVTPEM